MCFAHFSRHRIDTILDSDKVLVMDQGSVAEFASPQVGGETVHVEIACLRFVTKDHVA
jgi:hypothetical protein